MRYTHHIIFIFYFILITHAPPTHPPPPTHTLEDNFISSDKDKPEDWRGVKGDQENSVIYTAFTDNSYTNCVSQ